MRSGASSAQAVPNVSPVMRIEEILLVKRRNGLPKEA
jgi:hypothetical protein